MGIKGGPNIITMIPPKDEYNTTNKRKNKKNRNDIVRSCQDYLLWGRSQRMQALSVFRAAMRA